MAQLKTSESASWLDKLGQLLLGEPKDLQQLLELLQDAEKRHLIDHDALAMIEGVLQVSELRVRDIMIPRSRMVVLPRTATLTELVPTIVESAHSRFPVIEDEKTEVVGILLAKDLLPFMWAGNDKNFDIRDVLRPATIVPESKRLNVLLKDFRTSRNHMAIVVDEYGAAAGLVTIEDVLEQIVGEIVDEHDFEEGTHILARSDKLFTIKARTPVATFNEYFSASLTEDETDTIGGLVTRTLGHMPKRGESLNLEGFRFEVLRADSRRVHLFRLFLDAASDGDSSEA